MKKLMLLLILGSGLSFTTMLVAQQPAPAHKKVVKKATKKTDDFSGFSQDANKDAVSDINKPGGKKIPAAKGAPTDDEKGNMMGKDVKKHKKPVH